jgi:DTW domain-containing protein YfiP
MTSETLRCPNCDKPTTICVCDRITPLATKTRVLVLQHPQEPDKDLGTAKLLERSLPQCKVEVGLSWPSLAAALGDESADPKRWAVLYPLSLPAPIPEELAKLPVIALSRKGEPIDIAAQPFHGIVALDGTWSQGKTLWWRNAWLLKLGRLVIEPRDPGIYGRIRKEPRRSFVSTLEAVADALDANGEPAIVRDELRKTMRTMVQRARDTSKRPSRPRAPKHYDD